MRSCKAALLGIQTLNDHFLPIFHRPNHAPMNQWWHHRWSWKLWKNSLKHLAYRLTETNSMSVHDQNACRCVCFKESLNREGVHAVSLCYCNLNRLNFHTSAVNFHTNPTLRGCWKIEMCLWLSPRLIK